MYVTFTGIAYLMVRLSTFFERNRKYTKYMRHKQVRPQRQFHEAKAKFSTLVDAALLGIPQHVSKHGKDAVVVLSAQDFAALKRSDPESELSFVQHLLAIPKQGSSKVPATRTKPVKTRQGEARTPLVLRDLEL